jgi:hypothetical protein
MAVINTRNRGVWAKWNRADHPSFLILVVLDPYGRWPCGLLRSPRVPSGPSGVSLDPPVCPPVPVVSLGSYSSIGIVQL